MAGLGPDGLSILRYPEILENIEQSERTNIDPNIVTNPDELLGQINAIISDAQATLWEVLESVNDNFNKDKAEGNNLDDLAALVNVFRRESTRTTGLQNFTGVLGTTITAGSLLKNTSTLDVYDVKANVLITNTANVGTVWEVSSLNSTTAYTLTIDSELYSYTSDANPTSLEILNGLKAAIDLDTSAKVIATVDVDDLILVLASIAGVLSTTTASDLNLVSATSQGTVDALNTGVLISLAGFVTEIVTPLSGWSTTTNPETLTRGTARESDSELRVRLSQNQSLGGATVPAIIEAVGGVVGVTATSVIENRTFTVDSDGRPPKSFEVLVTGGLDSEVAQAIWGSKPAGIETFGSSSSPVLDSNGDVATDGAGTVIPIMFSRTQALALAFLVTYTTYDEEVFPSDGEDLIKNVVTETTKALLPGADIIPNRYFGPIYAAVGGIDNLIVQVQKIPYSGAPTSSGLWSTGRLAIDPSDSPDTEIVDVFVNNQEV